MVSRTTYDRLGRLESTFINTGCLCRTDGAVPSVNGASHVDGSHATEFEDWQQGCAVVYYTDDEFFVDLVQIKDGRAMFHGRLFSAI